MTSPFSAKLIVSVATLLCLIHFSSVCNAMRMLREENYQGKGTENDNNFKEKKDSTQASPNIGGSPFTFNIPPFSMPFNIPNFNIPGFGSGGLSGFGSPDSTGAGGLSDFGSPGAGGLPGFGSPDSTGVGGLPDFGSPGAGGLPGFGSPDSTGVGGLPDFGSPGAGGLSDFESPGVGGLPGFGTLGSTDAGGLTGFGSLDTGVGDNNPFTLPMPGVLDVSVQPPTATP